jgi:hypothetical protein
MAAHDAVHIICILSIMGFRPFSFLPLLKIVFFVPSAEADIHLLTNPLFYPLLLVFILLLSIFFSSFPLSNFSPEMALANMVGGGRSYLGIKICTICIVPAFYNLPAGRTINNIEIFWMVQYNI